MTKRLSDDNYIVTCKHRSFTVAILVLWTVDRFKTN